MSTVQVPVYTTASTVTPLPYEVVPTTTTMLPPSSVATILPLGTTTVPVTSRSTGGRSRKNRSLQQGGQAASVASLTPITAVPIVATDAGPIYEIELKKRLLDGQRELREKQADMEGEKEKKLEEKADKHRTKAVKWTGRGFPGMAARHERNATKLDVKANEHYMVAEQLRTQAKAIDRERKSFDPPKEEKKQKGPAGAKSAAMKRPAGAAAAGAPAPAAQRSATSTTTTQQPTPNGPVQRTERKQVTEQQPVPNAAAPNGSAQPVSLQKTEQVTQQQPVTTDTAAAAPVEDVAPAAAAAPAGDEVKTEKKVEETPDGEKKTEKKTEEKHHHLLHHKNEQSAGGSSH